MSKIPSYPKVYALGHRMIDGIFDGEVEVTEKVDGSQFSFGVIDGELHARSKGAVIDVNDPPNLFGPAVETVRAIAGALLTGAFYRGEAFQKQKHNTLAYSRVPTGGVILFDIDDGLQHYGQWDGVRDEALRLGLDLVPIVYHGHVRSYDDLREHLERESCLGGVKVEGLVVKNYAKVALDGSGKAMMGKLVSEAFKEKHSADWKGRNPTSKDIVQRLIETYRTEARWQKSVQHLHEIGALEGSPRDIGALIREVPVDVLSEYGDEIRDVLFGHFWPQIRRGLTAGLPEWYKETLARSAFPE